MLMRTRRPTGFFLKFAVFLADSHVYDLAVLIVVLWNLWGFCLSRFLIPRVIPSFRFAR